ncbi:F-box protein At5g03100-like [Silene latifolia]|uniref:F-box protein At5g03100-like n=1 Tax=Silene latifolia TaxID=37657 RepID=UPI003D786240
MDSSSNDSRNSSLNHEYISEEQSDYLISSDEQEDEHESPVFDPFYSSDEQESPRKRIKRTYVDRITNLPDALITHILSLLPVETAMKTQLLSKRWRYLWASSPVLTYSPKSSNEFITNTLMLHKGQLKTLSLAKIEGYNDLEPPTNLWLQCAVNKQIEVLVLEIDRYENSYPLPHSFFSCDSLKELSLSASKFDWGHFSVFWKSLKKLSLENIRNLFNEKIHKIIEGSPGLESFNLSHCAGFSRINVSSSCKLRNLVINYCGNRYDDDADRSDKSLEISGPNIRSLEISGYMEWQNCRLKDVSSLVQVNFRFYASKLDVYHRDYNLNLSDAASKMMHMLVRNISHVEKLSLGSWCTQVLSICELEGEPTIPLQCKTLEILSLNERSIPGIARLLRSAHYLERLTIDTEPFQPHLDYHEVENPTVLKDFNCENYWKSSERAAFNNPWQHLKVVQFIRLFDIMETKYMTELAEYVLDHAKVLEKLVLKAGEGTYRQSRSSDLRHSSLFQIMLKLLSCPRCSHHARVLLL